MKIFQENKNVEKHQLEKIESPMKDQDIERLYNEDALMASKIKSDKHRRERYLHNVNFHNNSNICYRFGQVNVEKALFVLIIQMLYTALLIYAYIYDLEKVLIYLYLISAGIDLILMTIFIYFVLK